MWKDFKQFINRGNVMDMAIGVIIGAAFGAIVTSLTNNILMPVIGIVIGGIDFSGLAIKVGDATINYGLFIQSIIDFLIIAFCAFLLTRLVNKFSKKKEEPKKGPTESEKYLMEIRDILKNSQNKR